jgi:hypothetical protein
MRILCTQWEAQKEKKEMSNNLCSNCALSALCLPIGVHKFAHRFIVCEQCFRAFYYPDGNATASSENNQEVSPNIACFWLMVHILRSKSTVCHQCLDRAAGGATIQAHAPTAHVTGSGFWDFNAAQGVYYGRGPVSLEEEKDE